MFIDEIKKAFGVNTTIFAGEIVDLFSNYSRAYVFRLIRKAEESGELASFSRGVYYIPKNTFFGQSTICSEMVAEKKYLRDKKSVYGIYAGLSLLNQFGITTQVPNTMEIVTNNETTRRRTIEIDGRKFILRKSRCEITRDNYPVYTILQLFYDMNERDELDSRSKARIDQYMKDNGVTMEKLFSMSKAFPSLTLKKMVESGALNAAI